MTNAVPAHGATLSWNEHVVALLSEIPFPDMTADSLPATTHDSPDSHKEFKAGLRDGGELNLQGYFYPGDTDGQIAMFTDYQAGTTRAVIITPATAAACTLTFNGFITKLAVNGPAEGMLGISISIKVTGKPVLAVTASTGMSALTGIEENAGAALVFVPTFAIGTFLYSEVVNTASTWIKLTPTAASHTITISNGTESQVVTSGAQSGEIDLGAAGTITTITVTVQESGKTAKIYTIYITRL